MRKSATRRLLSNVSYVTLLVFAHSVSAESLIRDVEFKADNDKAQVMVSVDLLNVLDLFKGPSPTGHFEFDSDYPLNFVQTDPDAETIARLLERYQAEQPTSTHWSRNAGKYKTAAVVAAIGTAVAVIVGESKESSGRDQNITAGNNVNFNTGTVGGNNGNNEASETEFEGLE